MKMEIIELVNILSWPVAIIVGIGFIFRWGRRE